MPIYCFNAMVPKEEAIFGNLPATHLKFTGRLGSLQATLYTLNSQLTRFGNSPVFPLHVLHPAIMVLQLIYSAGNVQIAPCQYCTGFLA